MKEIPPTNASKTQIDKYRDLA